MISHTGVCLTLEQPSELALGRPSFWFCQEARAHVFDSLSDASRCWISWSCWGIGLGYALFIVSLHPWRTKRGSTYLSLCRLLSLSAVSPPDCSPSLLAFFSWLHASDIHQVITAKYSTWRLDHDPSPSAPHLTTQ